MVDSHCHLADAAFEADLPDVVARARAAGVASALCVLAAGDDQQAARARRLDGLWPEVRYAIGVHPHAAGDFADRPDRAAELVRREIAANPAARAVGEVGLDYYYDRAPRPVQQEVFRHQVRVARALRLPLVIHTREADADTFTILDLERAGEVGGVFHCFTGGPDMARRALDLGFHVSFSGIVTFPKATDVREAARVVPADRLLAETDSPYLSPVPYRGRTRNEPAWVVHVLAELAHLRGEDPATTAGTVARAYHALVTP